MNLGFRDVSGYCSAVTALQGWFQSLHQVYADRPNFYPHPNKLSHCSKLCQAVMFKATSWKEKAFLRKTCICQSPKLSRTERSGYKRVPKLGSQEQCNSKVLLTLCELFQRFSARGRINDQNFST